MPDLQKVAKLKSLWTVRFSWWPLGSFWIEIPEKLRYLYMKWIMYYVISYEIISAPHWVTKGSDFSNLLLIKSLHVTYIITLFKIFFKTCSLEYSIDALRLHKLSSFKKDWNHAFKFVHTNYSQVPINRVGPNQRLGWLGTILHPNCLANFPPYLFIWPYFFPIPPYS